jgi:hypothetical protein
MNRRSFFKALPALFSVAALSKVAQKPRFALSAKQRALFSDNKQLAAFWMRTHRETFHCDDAYLTVIRRAGIHKFTPSELTEAFYGKDA